MQKFIPNKIIWFGIFIAILSIIANLIFFALTKAFGEQYSIPLTNSPAYLRPMSVAMVFMATLLSAVLATGLYSLLAKIAPNSIIHPFLSITGTALLVSFGGPMELPGTLMQTKIFLSLMHINTAMIIIGGFYIFYKLSNVHHVLKVQVKTSH